MKKIILIILSIVLTITAILLVIFNIICFKDWKSEKISVRKTHQFICNLEKPNSERELTNNYVYDIITDEDYLIKKAKYIEEIHYNNSSDSISPYRRFHKNARSKVSDWNTFGLIR